MNFSRVFPYYIRSWSFLKTDFLLASRYFLRSPHLHIRHLKESFTYGPTPLSVWSLLAHEAGLTSKDIVYDLGCGTGRGLFWLTTFVKCRAKGIDLTTAFIKNALWTQKKAKCGHVSFVEEDVFTTDLDEATCIYLYGTCFSEEEIKRLIERFKTTKPKTKIITVSYSLNEFENANDFAIEKHLKVAYPWGKADVFIHRKL